MLLNGYVSVLPNALEKLEEIYEAFRNEKDLISLVTGIEEVCKKSSHGYEKNKNHINTEDIWFFEALFDNGTIFCFRCKKDEKPCVEIYKKMEYDMQFVNEIIEELSKEFSEYY